MKQLFYCLLVIMLAGCKEKYNLPFTTSDTGYLVIEGFINRGPGLTLIELSRTNKLTGASKKYERGARVQVEGDDNSMFPLIETGVGGYTASLNLLNNNKYRLRIKTISGKEYLSDFVEVKVTPPVDSISWQRESTGVQLNINTHDPQNNTRYYQWDYKETWEFHAAYRSVLKYVTKPGPFGTTVANIEYKDPVTFRYDSTIWKCWRSNSSNLLLIGSSAKLSQDVIFNPFLLIPAGDQKISELYSINVRQYALTKPGYEFMEKVKKNTEQTGSIFDAQPSQLQGNIHCLSDESEPVIGYVNVCSVEEKRLFIQRDDVPNWNFASGCKEKSVPNNRDSITDSWLKGNVPTDALTFFGSTILTYGETTFNCIDCTLYGTNVKPDFWPR
jgi:hypothetical protein